MRIVVFYEDKNGNEHPYFCEEHFRKIKSIDVYEEHSLKYVEVIE